MTSTELPTSGSLFGLPRGVFSPGGPEERPTTSSNVPAADVSGQPEAMDTKIASNAETAPIETGPASLATPTLKKPTMECPAVACFGEPSTIPNTAFSVEQAVRSLLASIPRENLLDIFKDILGETHEIVPTKAKKKKSASKKAPINPLGTKQTQEAPAAAGTTPIPDTTPHAVENKRASSIPAGTLAPPPSAVSEMPPATREEPEDTVGWTQVTYKKKRKRVRGDPTQQTSEEAKSTRRWQYEYKIRLTRSQISIKPLLPLLKMHLTGTHISTAFTMHLIEKANTISVRTDSKELAETLEKITEIGTEEKGKIPIQVFRTYGNTHSKGVFYDIYPKKEDPQGDVLNSEIESEKPHVVAARRLGKSNTAILTFDGEKTPRSVLYGKRYMRVFPFKPKAVTCGHCHRLGHKFDICPNTAVCPICGTDHPKPTDLTQGPGCTDTTPYCQGCKKKGHLGTDRKCPTWQETNKRMRKDIKSFREQHKLQQQQQEIANRPVKTPVPPSENLWANKVKQGLSPPPLPSPTAEAQELSNTCNFLKAELNRLNTIVQSLQEENKKYREYANHQRALAAQFFMEK